MVLGLRGFRMLRVLATFVLLQLLAQGTGVLYAAQEAACRDQDPAGQTEDCNSGCEDCLCCAHHRVMVVPPAGDATPLDMRELVFARVSIPVTDPAPNEIMHVPRSGRSA